MVEQMLQSVDITGESKEQFVNSPFVVQVQKQGFKVAY